MSAAICPLPSIPLLFIDNFDMDVEPLYTDESPAVQQSAASVFFGRLITFLWFASWGFFALFLILICASVLGILGVEPLKSQLFADTDAMSAFILLLSVLVHISVFLIILRQLQNVCKTLAAGDPFVPKNAHRLRVIWIAVACGELLRHGGTFFFAYLNGKGVIDYAPTATAGGDMTIELRIYVWFLVLALIIFAEVFREGARLRQEQKLTV